MCLGFFFKLRFFFCWLQEGQSIDIVRGKKSTIGPRKNKVCVNIGVHGYCVPNIFKTARVTLFMKNTISRKGSSSAFSNTDRNLN